MSASDSKPAPNGLFAGLRFRQSFRKYQQMVLDMAESKAEADRKYHIVSPPGSGKTIVGLELIRRFGRPAVVFAPTTTIQRQWQEKVALFTDDPGWVAEHTSLDPAHLSDLNVLTYQVLSTPGENLAFIERIAVERWADDLLTDDKVRTEDEARQRIATLQESNPQAFRQEVAKRYRRLKGEILRRGDFDGRQFLHPNARDLIDRIVAHGTGTVVLDECHHLLDYWAFILRELIRALPDARVIGLTATLPDPANETEYENYNSLLGDVDFEVPTPAVVKEGNLAPYRDLVYFCEPSRREHRYLQDIQEHFTAAVRHVTDTPAFQEWVRRMVVERRPPGAGPEAPQESFEDLFNRAPALCIAGVKCLLVREEPLPPDIPILEEMLQPLNVDDWLTLLEAFSLQVLKVSSDPDHHDLYEDLHDVLLSFGITISERGIHHQRSPGDLVLALSESKDQATVDILSAEAEAMGERLRAIVITDYERMSARARRLKDVLDPDAGSAVRVFRRLLADPATTELNPILVTGKVVLADASNRDRVEEGIKRWSEKHQANLVWEWQPTDDFRILQITGSGADWTTRTYVALLTDLFEHGITRCLVGTRGIFGEGWDALSLNTLIDLTSVTTSTGVQQIRGRSLRLDPNWSRKVAHNWDVVCYSAQFDKGDMDLRRFEARHRHTWGIIVRSRLRDLGDAVERAIVDRVPPLSMQGRVVRGPAHVDMDLSTDLTMRDFKHVNFRRYTRRMVAAVRERDRVYDLWAVGQPYSNFNYSATQIEPKDLKFRTAYTVQESLKAMTWRLLVSILATAAVVWLNGFVLLPRLGLWPESALLLLLGGLTVVAAGATVAVNLRSIWRVFRHTFLELPADAILLDMGRALLAALCDAGVVSRNLSENYVRAVETAEGGYEVFLDYASPEDSDIFSQAYRELMGPLGDARYLIERDSASLRNVVYRPLWLLVRTALGLGEDLRAYHRVPDVLASHRERAEDLARQWARYVGGGRLVYTRTPEGRRILLQARAQPRRRVRQTAFEIWK